MAKPKNLAWVACKPSAKPVGIGETIKLAYEDAVRRGLNRAAFAKEDLNFFACKYADEVGYWRQRLDGDD